MGATTAAGNDPRRALAVAAALLLCLIAGCAGAPPSPTDGTRPTDAAVVPAQTDRLSARVDDLALLVPADAMFVLELPGFEALTKLAVAEQRALIDAGIAEVDAAASAELGLETGDAKALIEAIDGVAVYAATSTTPRGALLIRLGEAAGSAETGPLRRLLASKLLEPERDTTLPGANVWRIRGEGYLAWFPAARVLCAATQAAELERVVQSARGTLETFAVHEGRVQGDRSAVRLYADLAAIAAALPNAEGALGAGSRFRGSLRLGEEGVRSRFELQLRGRKIPALGGILEPRPTALAPRLPLETVGFASLGLARRAGRSLRDLVVEIARVAGAPDAVDELDATSKQQLGMGLADLDAALGSELVVGMIVDPQAQLDPEKLLEDGAFVAALGWNDDARGKALVGAIGKLLDKALKKDFKVRATPGALQIDPIRRGEPAMRLAAQPGALVFQIGAARWQERVAASFGKGDRTLSGSPGYRATAARVHEPASGLLWIDMSAIGQLAQRGATVPEGTIGLGRALIAPAAAGLDVTLEGENGSEMAIVGVAAALGIYGVRRYLAASKTSEAKNTIGAIARGAVAGYEREQGDGPTPTHRLCASAPPVPSIVPPAKKYAPDPREYESGDQQGGWRCLRFMMTMPHYYQYEYRHGGPYKGPARGGPDPGPNGFEASAEGDLDGDGKTSLFTRIGKVNPRTKMIEVSPEIFVADEFE